MFRMLLTASAFALAAGAATAAQDAQTDDYLPEGVVESPGLTEEAIAPDPLTVATKEDARQFGETEFAIADANGDGALDEAEFTAYVTAHLQTSMAANAPIGEGDIDAAADAEAFVTPQEAFAEISNGEETISEDALVEARIASFDEADANGDETLDDSEREQFAALVTGKQGW